MSDVCKWQEVFDETGEFEHLKTSCGCEYEFDRQTVDDQFNFCTWCGKSIKTVNRWGL